MRRKDTFVKALCSMLSIVLLATGCYDDSAIWNTIKDQEARLVKLELLAEQFNTNLSSLQGILDALKDNDYATNVTPVLRNGKEVGFTMTFSKKDPVTIYFGEVSVDDLGGQFPEIGVNKDTDGNYYWTLNGLWLTDESGEKILASGTAGKDGAPGTPGETGKDGVTPKLKIEDSKWYVSYDNGTTWELLGNIPNSNTGSAGTSGESIFSGVKNLENSVVLTLNDGTEIVVPKKKTVSMAQSELKATSVVFTGVANPVSPDYEVGIYYSTDSNVQIQKAAKVSCFEFDENNGFVIRISGLKPATKYYWRSYVSMYGDVEYGAVQSFVTEDMPRLVKNITYKTISLSGEIDAYSLDYAYDNDGRPIEFGMSELGDEDGIVFKIVPQATTGEMSVEGYSYGELRTVSAVKSDAEGRVVYIDEEHRRNYGGGQYEIEKSESSLEYNVDGTHKKMTTVNKTYSSEYMWQFEYSDGCLSAINAVFVADDETDSEKLVFDTKSYAPNRYPADLVNVDISMIQVTGMPEEAYTVLTHLGYCGKGYAGEYLCETLNTDMFASNIIHDSWYGTTTNPDYRKQVTEIKYKSRDEVCPLVYEFDSEGYPVRFTSKIPYDQYETTYDLIPGEVLGQWEEYDESTGQVKICYEYQIVVANMNMSMLDTKYEEFIGEITYLSEDNSGTNEMLKENEGSWLN